MASNLSDDARRADILRRAHAGLQEDLDDMRAELTDDLPDYEQRLRFKSDALPDWLDMSPAQVRALFHLKPVTLEPDADAPQDPSPAHGILGPRTVALAAGRIEIFIEQSFVDADFDDETRTQRLGDFYSETCAYLSALITEARRVAEHAATNLNTWLDEVLYELENQRKIDVEALEDLVGQGDIGRGDKARQEIADLWEEQRRRAAELQACWQPLNALVREGLTSTESGLAELAEMLNRARAGLVGANAAFKPLLPPFEWPSPPADLPMSTPPKPQQVEDAGPTLDLSATAVLSSNGPAEAREDTRELDSDTAMTAPELKHPERERPGDEQPDTIEPNTETNDDIGETTAHTLLSEDSHIPGIIPLDEPSSDSSTTAAESSSVSDYSEPTLNAGNLVTDAPRTATQRLYTRTETPSSGHPTAPASGDTRHTAPTQSAHKAPEASENDLKDSSATENISQTGRTSNITTSSAPSPTGASLAEPTSTENTATRSTSGEATSSDEATYTQCFRIRPGYKPAPLLEVLGILLPPAFILGGMALLSILHLLGVEAGFNPFERWSWAFSAAAAALAWLLLLPALRRWRSKWRGTKLIIMRHADVREEAALRFDAHALSLGDTTWRWERLNRAELRRWDSPLDEVCGWSLAIAAPNTPALRLATPESNRKKWQNSPYQLVETPYDAWQVSPYDFDTISRRAR